MTDTVLDEEDDSLMSPDAFEYAVTGLPKIAAKTKEAARLVLVEGLKRTEAREKTGVSGDTLHKSLKRIAANLDKKLKADDLYLCSHITTKELLNVVESTESLVLESKMAGGKARKKT